MRWGGEGRGGERRGGNMHKSTPLAGDLHLREIMRQLLSHRYKGLGVNQGYQVQFPAGSQRIVNLFSAGMPVNMTGKVSGESDVWSVIIWWQWWSLGFLNA